MPLPQPSLIDLHRDCARTVLAVNLKHQELLRAVSFNAEAGEVTDLRMKLEALTELWLTACDALVSAARSPR